MQLAIEDEVIMVCRNPYIGRQKLGDLQEVFVHKFRFNQQEYLIAYQFAMNKQDNKLTWLEFFQVGTHENFYAELKRTLRLK